MKKQAHSFEEYEVDPRRLRTFLAVLRAGSLARGAVQLGLAQSTVTVHIQALEAGVGLRLLERRGRRLELTEAGRAFSERAEGVLASVAELGEAMRDLHCGDLGTVAAGAIEPIASTRLPAVVARFCAGRPKVNVRVLVGGTAALSRMVAAGELDFAIASAPPSEFRLTFEPLLREPLGVLLPDRDGAARPRPIVAAELGSRRLIVTEEGCAYRELVAGFLGRRGIRPQGLIEIGSLPAIVGAVQEGLGAAILPVAAASPVPPGTSLHRLAGEELALSVGLVTPLNRGGSSGRPIAQALARAARIALSRSATC